mgnify:FL=1
MTTTASGTKAGTRASNATVLGASVGRRLTSPLSADILVAIAVFLVLYLIVRIVAAADVPLPPSNDDIISTDPINLPYYAACSLLRMFAGLVCSYAFALAFGYWAAHSQKAERLLIPALDVLQSVPVLGFLSITVTGFLALFPGSQLGLEFAAIFAIFTAQAWNLAFSMYNSSLTMPDDMREMSSLFRMNSWLRFWRLEVPNAAIGLVWNGMMSMGGAWFFLTAAETISVAGQDYSVPGIGAYAGIAIDQGNMANVGWAIFTMVIVVVGVNVLFWRPLVAWAERFKNEQSAAENAPKSGVLNLVRAARLPGGIGAARRRASDKISLGVTKISREPRTLVATSPRTRRAWDVVFWCIVVAGLGYGVWHLLLYVTEESGFGTFLEPIGLGALTMLRVLAVLVLSTLIWVPVGIKIGLNPRLSRYAQPLVQIFASFPANFLFPFVTAFLLATGISINWGSIFLMMLGAQWYILFNVIAGAQAMPSDLREAMANMRVGGWLWWKRFALPAVMPSYVTGGITASGGAWNASIVAEVVSFGSTTLTAAGLGAYISAASAAGNQQQLLTGVIVMSAFVLIINRVLWRPLYNLAEKRYSL